MALRIPPVSPFKEKLARDQPPIPKKRNPAQNKSSMKRRWGEGGRDTAEAEPSTFLVLGGAEAVAWRNSLVSVKILFEIGSNLVV